MSKKETNVQATGGPREATVTLEPSNPVVTSYIPFDAPTNVHATVREGEATVTWDAPANTGGFPVDFYEIYDPTFTIDEFVDGSTTSAVLSGLTNGTTYTFRVIAYNTDGNSSAPSDQSKHRSLAISA